MSQLYGKDPDVKKDSLNLLDASDKPEIRVLVYTDDPTMVREDGIFGIRELRRQLDAHAPAFARISLSSPISRNSDAAHHADHKIDDELNDAKSPYHQVWFFGVHQANKDKFKLEFPGGGGPHSELESDEVEALKDWMTVNQKDGSKGIGVLVAGDHANPPPDQQPISGSTKFCPPGLDHEQFLGLGRAIGEKIPRAGLLRKWKGPPTHCSEDSFNTLFPPPNQKDARPQELMLPRFDQHGNPSPTGQPHNLFRGKDDEWIQVLPDHQHEGAVVLPPTFPEKIWPAAGPLCQPVPRVIALGTDRRTGRQLNILAAYDGDAAGVGRVVSDSSWHHYFNVNLQNLSAANLDLPAADQIGQFYSNLVIWLSPLSIRRAMANSMVIWLATHPLMIEEVSAGPLNIGTLALQLLRQVASDCEIHELLLAACPESLRNQFETLKFPREPETNHLPTVEVLLGSILSKYFETVGPNSRNLSVNDPQLATIIRDGFTHAFVLNAISTVTFSYQSLRILLSSQPPLVPTEVVRIFHALESINLLHQPQKRRILMNTNPELTLRMDLTSDEETFDFTLETGPGECVTFEPLGFEICPLSGWVTSEFERYEVRGFLIEPLHWIYLEFPFRRVKLIMGGVVKDNDTILMRFVAVHPDVTLQADLPEVMAINPEEGETGTGTATQTRLSPDRVANK